MTSESAAGERLQKVLARAGLGSRRHCEELIAAGRVTVNGEIATLGRRVDPEHDRVELDGARIVVDSTTVVYLLHKPAGTISSASDPQGRPTVVDLVPATPRVFPVGRLDYDTEGLLLLTNDGELANLLTHPRHGVAKTYLVEVTGHPSSAALGRLRRGIELDDGPTAPAVVRVAARRAGATALEMTIHEGRNRQIRRMCEAVGHPVTRLVRTRIGPLRAPDLGAGTWRRLDASEIAALHAAAGDASAGAGSEPGASGRGDEPGRR